jgi:hypothetical protein
LQDLLGMRMTLDAVLAAARQEGIINIPSDLAKRAKLIARDWAHSDKVPKWSQEGDPNPTWDGWVTKWA